ncbi:MAG: type VI secretion system tube protein Hcp [Pirellulaceae bacterium]
MVDDSRATQQNTGLPIKLSSLLRNDIRTAAVTSFGQPAHGTVTYQSGADTFVYTPDPGFVGTDSFTYTGQNTLGDELILTLADADLNTVQLPVSNAKWQLNVSPSTLGSSGPVDISGSDFQFTLEMNQATPAILSALTSGEVLPKVSLTQFRIIDGAAVELGRWTLHNARISSLTSTDLTDGLPPGEMYSIAYDKLEYDVTLPNDKTGNRETAGARVHVGFDDVKNTPFDSAQFGSASVGKFGKNSENLEKLAGTYLKINNNLITEIANWDLAFTEGSIREKTQRLTFQLDSSADPVVAAYFMGRAISQETLADVVLRKQQQAEGNNLLKQQVALKNVVVRSVSTDVNLAGKNITSVTLEYDKVQVARSIVQKTGETGENGRFVAWDFAETKVAENFDSGKFTGAVKPELRKEPGEGPETVLSTDFGDIDIISFSYVSGSEDSAATIDAIEFQASFDVMAPEILRRLLNNSVESKPMTLTRLLTNGDTRSQVLALELTGAKVTSFSLQLSADDSNGVYRFTVSANKVKQTNTFDFDGQGAAPQVVTVDHRTGEVTPASAGFSSNSPRTSSLALRIGSAEVEIDRVQVAAAVIADEAKGISEITGDRITIFSNWNQFSASILTASLVGQVIPEVQLIQRTSGMSDLQFAKKLTLKNVVVEKYGTADSFGRPLDESFDLRFDSIKVDVSDPITGDGKLVEAFTGYDFKQKEVADDRKVVSPIKNDERIIGFLQSSSPALVTTGLATPISSFSFDGAAGTTDPFSVTVSLPFSQGALALLDRLYGSGVDSTLTLSNGARGKLNQTWELSNAFVTSVNFDVLPGEPSEASITLQYDGLKLTNHRFDNTGRKSGEQSVEIDPVRPSVIGSTSIPGNVSDPQFRSTTINFGSGEFEVLSSRWGASAAGTSGASINVDDSDFRFETRYSESLTGLVTALASGQTYANVTIARYQRSPDRSSFAALTWKLKNVQVSSVSVSTDFETPGHGLISFSLSPDVVRQELKWPNQTTGVPTDVDPFEFNFNERQLLADAAFETLEQLRQDTAVVTVQVNGVQDPDTDSVGDAIEDGAPNNGDGNNDGTADSQQNNVTSLPHPITGDYVTLAAPAGQNLTAVSISANPDESVTPPADIDFRVGVIEYELKNTPSSGATTITIFVDGTSGFNTYYKFGPTPSNPTPHYYRFLYDGRTGAEIFEDRIVVHLRDGERGDDDLTVNGVIVDPGAPAINLSLFPHQNSMLRSDVNDDGEVSPIDALLIINELNLNGAGPLPVPLAFPITANKLLDVNGDNEVSPIDVGIVITELNARLGGEGERLFAGLTEANPFAAGNLTPSLVAAETTAAIESERGIDSSRKSDGSLLAPLGSTNHVRESLFATFDSRRDAAASQAGRATALSIESPNSAHFGQVFAARRSRLHRDLSRFESDVDSLFESWDGDAG